MYSYLIAYEGGAVVEVRRDRKSRSRSEWRSSKGMKDT